MKKIKRKGKELINFFKSIRFSTLYKFCGILLLIITLYLIITTTIKTKNISTMETHTISGVIIDTGTNYILMKDNRNTIYLLKNSKNTFKIGDTVETTLNSIEKTLTKPNIIIANNGNIVLKTENSVPKDAAINCIEYAKETNHLFQDITTKEEEIKMRYQNIIEFLFNNGKINNISLNSINSENQLQIIKIALTLDYNVENSFIGYKESLNGTVFSNIKKKLITIYLNKASDLCTYDSYLCQKATHDFQILKNTFSLNWNQLKDLTTDNDRLKSWYEIYSSKSE